MGGSLVTAVALVVIAAAVFRSATPPGGSPAAAGLPPGTWKIGLDMPLSGDTAFRGIPMRNAVQLAIKDANAAGGIDGSQLGLDIFDDGGPTPTGQDPALGAANAQVMVADRMTLAMIGPSGSGVAMAVIPVTNRAGLLECSPSNTSPALTKPRYGALDLRSAHPSTINFVRIAPSDDIQAPALASFAYNDLNATVALVVDDAADGRQIADGFQEAYTSIGGQVVRRALNPGADPMTVLAPLSQRTDRPGVVFFGGFTDTGAVGLRKAMLASGHGDIPFLSWDGLFDGSGADKGSYIQRVTAAGSAGSYVSHATQPPTKNTFVEAYRQAYHAGPMHHHPF